MESVVFMMLLGLVFAPSSLLDCEKFFSVGAHGTRVFKRLHKHRAAGGGILLLDLQDLFLDDFELPLLAAHDGGELLNELLELLQLLLELEDFELGEPREAQIEDGLRLPFGEVESLSEFVARVGRRIGVLDDLDDLVDVAHGDDEAFQDMAALLRLVEIELRAAQHDFALVFDVIADDLQ